MLQEWFKKSRLGIFIHYGIYAVNGTSESWAFKTGECSYKTYMKQKDGFTASKYDPNEWAELFRKAGASYCVLTSKHHDGVALFDTAEKEGLSVIKDTPCKKDLIAPYCEAMRKQGLKVGLYFTQLDWSHPDYTSMHWKSFSMFLDKRFGNNKRWQNFKAFHRRQLKEILTNYGSIDLIWFDGDWERTQTDWDFKEMRQFLDEYSPQTVINSRIGKYGDYETPEQQIPVQAPKGYWEYCMTANDSWGYRPKDKNFKSSYEIERTLCEIATMGGILLLDFGPKEDGTLPQEAVAILNDLAKFYQNYRQGVYESEPIDNDFYAGGAAKDKENHIYLYVYGRPLTNEVVCRLNGKTVTKAVCAGKTLSLSQKDGYTVMGNLPKQMDELSVITLSVSCETENCAVKESTSDSASVLLAKFACKEANVARLKECQDLSTFVKENETTLCELEKSAPIDRKFYAGYGFLSEDGKKITLLEVNSAPSIMVKGLTAKPQKITVNGQSIPFKVVGAMGGEKAGTLWINPPKSEKVFLVTLEFKKPVRFYSGDGTPNKPKE